MRPAPHPRQDTFWPNVLHEVTNEVIDMWKLSEGSPARLGYMTLKFICNKANSNDWLLTFDEAKLSWIERL